MSFSQNPLKWNNVFQPVVYTHIYDTATFTSVTDVGGFAKFNFSLSGSYTGIRRIYISSGVYIGWHTVSAVTATSITTTSVYISTATGSLKIIEDVQFEIYVGYASGTYAVNNPERIIATIQPSPNLSAVLSFDIKEYLKAAWADDGYAPAVKPPTNGVDENMSTPFRVATLGRSASAGTTYYACYGVIPSGTLNTFDADGIFMSVETPIVFSCGCSIISQIVDTVIYNNITCGGVAYQEYSVEINSSPSTGLSFNLSELTTSVYIYNLWP